MSPTLYDQSPRHESSLELNLMTNLKNVNALLRRMQIPTVRDDFIAGKLVAVIEPETTLLGLDCLHRLFAVVTDSSTNYKGLPRTVSQHMRQLLLLSPQPFVMRGELVELPSCSYFSWWHLLHSMCSSPYWKHVYAYPENRNTEIAPKFTEDEVPAGVYRQRTRVYYSSSSSGHRAPSATEQKHGDRLSKTLGAPACVLCRSVCHKFFDCPKYRESLQRSGRSKRKVRLLHDYDRDASSAWKHVEILSTTNSDSTCSSACSSSAPMRQLHRGKIPGRHKSTIENTSDRFHGHNLHRLNATDTDIPNNSILQCTRLHNRDSCSVNGGLPLQSLHDTLEWSDFYSEPVLTPTNET